MNGLLKACSGALRISRTIRFGASSSSISCLRNTNLATTSLGPIFSTTFRIQCSSSSSSRKRTQKSKGPKPAAAAAKDEKDAFFVVRKGDVIGVYKSFADCQAQLGSSVCDPPVSVYKGYSLSKETQEYLVSCGLKSAIYSIRAEDLKADLFGVLAACPLQEAAVPTLVSTNHTSDQEKLDVSVGADQIPIDGHSCILEFDGASKGNPGLAGAGAVLRDASGSLVCRVREGLGQATNNVAEYHAMILGLKYALEKGYTHIRVQGDSKLVCEQLRGRWKVKNENMSELYKQAKQLKEKFKSFKISHVLRELNSEADAQANLAVQLADGEVQEEQVVQRLVGSSTSSSSNVGLQ